MKSYFNWFGEQGYEKNQQWLILGKGPSFSERSHSDISMFKLFSLNHAVREQQVTVAHIIDFDVVDACGISLVENTRVLVMPWYPHVKNKPGLCTLADLVRENAFLHQLEEEGRLLWYNLSTAPKKREGSPVIYVRFFSAEAALNLLAQAGVRKVRSLGIDGGAAYSGEFDDLKDKTLLSNKRKSFNVQFEKIAKIIFNTGIDYAPLNVETPIRVYVATTEAQMLSVKVLEYSIRKHASMSVKIYPMHRAGIEIPTPKDIRNHPRTPFSFQRLTIPALAGYRGRAVYLDSDMQVFKDIRDLWVLPFNGADCLAVREPGESGRRPQFSVMLLNCDLLKWDIQEIVSDLDCEKLRYEALMYDMAVANDIRLDIDPTWNSLEQFNEGATALIHYTDMATQPWVSTENPLGYLWVKDLFEAIDAGFIPLSFIEGHVGHGYVRPSLLYQITHRIEDSLLLPRRARLLDKDFVAPFHSIHKHGRTAGLNLIHRLRAAIRNMYTRSPISRLERTIRNRMR